MASSEKPRLPVADQGPGTPIVVEWRTSPKEWRKVVDDVLVGSFPETRIPLYEAHRKITTTIHIQSSLVLLTRDAYPGVGEAGPELRDVETARGAARE